MMMSTIAHLVEDTVFPCNALHMRQLHILLDGGQSQEGGEVISNFGIGRNEEVVLAPVDYVLPKWLP